MIYVVKPTPAENLKPGDFFRDGGQTFRIAEIECNEGVVEIAYTTEAGPLINSFFLSSDDTLDKIID